MKWFASGEEARVGWIALLGSVPLGLFGAVVRLVASRIAATDSGTAVTAGLVALAFAGTIAYLASLPSARLNVQRWRVEDSLGGNPRKARRRGLYIGALQGSSAAMVGWSFTSLAVMDADPARFGLWLVTYMTVTLVAAACVSALAYWLAYRTAAGEIPGITRKDLGLIEKPGPVARKLELAALATTVLGLVVGVVHRVAPMTYLPDSAKPVLLLWPRIALAAVMGTLAWVFLRVVTSAIGAALPSTGAGALSLLKHSLVDKVGKAFRYVASFMMLWFMVGTFYAAGPLDDALSGQSVSLEYGSMVGPAASAGVEEAAAAAERLGNARGLTVVPVQLVTVVGEKNAPNQGVVAIVDPLALDKVVDLGARPFGLGDGVLVIRDSWDDTAWFNADYPAIGAQTISSTTSGASVSVVAVWTDAPFTMMTPATASELMPESSPAWMVWADGLTPEEFDRVVNEVGAGALAESGVLPAQKFDVGEPGLMFVVVFALIVGSGAQLASGWQFGKSLRSSRALLLALGASPSRLSLAAALHGALVTLIAAPMAVAAGVLWGILEALPTALEPGAPFDLESELDTASWYLGQMPWGWIAFSVVASLAIGMVGTWALVRRKAGEPPAVQLREAIKEGAL